MENGWVLAGFARSAGLIDMGGIEWQCSLFPEKRKEILEDLYMRAMPGEVNIELSPEDQNNIDLREQGVIGAPIPERTKPCTEPQCHELREMLEESEMSKEEFLNFSEVDTFDEVPIVLIVYLGLYFDMRSGQFSKEAFDRQYNNGQGPLH